MVKRTLAFILATAAFLQQSTTVEGTKLRVRELIQEKAQDLSQGYWYNNGGSNNGGYPSGESGGSSTPVPYNPEEQMDYVKEKCKNMSDWSWDDDWKKMIDWKKCGCEVPPAKNETTN